MIFNNHSNLEGQHAFLGASKYHWINYDETKVADAYSKFLATQRGTVLHDFACQCITLGQKLPKSQKTLNMDGATKGLESIDSAAKKVDMSGLGSAVETVKTRFSALEIMAVTALANITNSVVNTGKQMLRSLTIEPISQGFEEYELKMGSIQTIMMSTGASLEEVNKYLQELNTYSDKTIYSFQDMTSNIGKFTNAGVGLEDAVMAIQGVSNVAAVSGANANEASRAMYNFAQALSAGYVKLIDWKSIENANKFYENHRLWQSNFACQ